MIIVTLMKINAGGGMEVRWNKSIIQFCKAMNVKFVEKLSIIKEVS